MSLREAFARFMRFRSPRLLVPAALAALATRLGLRGWRRRDVGIATAILAVEPFTEWIIHVGLLHFRPRDVAGRRIDPLVARKHREHHADPKDAELIFIPMEVLRLSIPASLVGWFLGERNVRTAMTGVATSLAMLTAYEWTHYLIHSEYRPRHRPYRGIWRAHRLHHFRNEHYWFGVTMHGADRVLRTFPERDAVPVSPTARTLGIAEAV